MALFFYTILLIGLLFYSYVLVDPNITFVSIHAWELFRDWAVQIGYHQRSLSWALFLIIVLGLFGFHLYFLNKKTQIRPLKVAIIIGIILLFSYPFLSKDFFNYMFDARIATFYHKNPYFFKAIDFQNYSWLRFMHWTHRTYPTDQVFFR